ncbi:MAG: cell division protein FtsZ, partial [Lysobacter sp.]
EYPMDDAVATSISPVPSFSNSLRSAPSQIESTPSASTAADFGPDSYLDIPAFLRRQAD